MLVVSLPFVSRVVEAAKTLFYLTFFSRSLIEKDFLPLWERFVVLEFIKYGYKEPLSYNYIKIIDLFNLYFVDNLREIGLRTGQILL